MNKRFTTAIKNLQPNNVIVLRHCRTLHEKKLLKQLTHAYNYVDLSLPPISSQAVRDATCFLKKLQLPVYLDNLQYAPQLLPLLAQGVLPYASVLASCTQSFALEELAQNLSNVRIFQLPMTEEDLLPFTFTERYLLSLDERERVDIKAQLWQGYRDLDDALYIRYMQSVLEADIIYLTKVSNSDKFYLLMRAAAAQFGQIVNFVKLAKEAEITAPTAKSWLRFLMGTGLVYLIWPVQNIGLKRLVSTPKLYFRDTGLACSLLNLNSVEELSQSEHLAQLEQNYALNKIRESYFNAALTPSVRFYRDNNKKNIDLILRQDGILYPVMLAEKELKVEKVQQDFTVLAAYAQAHGYELGEGAIIYPHCAMQKVLPDVWQVSADLF